MNLLPVDLRFKAVVGDPIQPFDHLEVPKIEPIIKPNPNPNPNPNSSHLLLLASNKAGSGDVVWGVEDTVAPKGRVTSPKSPHPKPH